MTILSDLVSKGEEWLNNTIHYLHIDIGLCRQCVAVVRLWCFIIDHENKSPYSGFTGFLFKILQRKVAFLFSSHSIKWSFSNRKVSLVSTTWGVLFTESVWWLGR